MLLATDHDAYARSTLHRPVARGWLTPEATAWVGVDPHEEAAYLSAKGSPEAVAALLADVVEELPPTQRVTLPRGTPARLPAWVGLDGTDWDFRWLAAPPPPQRGEDRVVDLDEQGIAAFLAAASPTASALPGSERVNGWVGVRAADGALLACAADTSMTPAIGHLSSIAVSPAARGQGLGSAVTAALTRRFFTAGAEIVTLGMYADNTAGRALYDRLGFADDHRFTSGRLQVRSRW